MISPLSAEEVRRVIHGEGAASRIPVVLKMWIHPWEFPKPEEAHAIMDRYPEDVQIVFAHIPQTTPDDPDYPDWCWFPRGTEVSTTGGMDERGALDWDDMDAFLAHLPDPDAYPRLFDGDSAPDGRYRLLGWWYFLFERHWQLRGMSNALTDFYEYPDEVHALYHAMTDFYIAMIRRAAREGRKFDGVFITDDLGTQRGPFFSPKIFDEFFAPEYKRFFDTAHELGMDVWMHACGDIRKFIPKLIGMGLDVLHPIQKYAMDEREIAANFGGQVTFWAGMDVQKTIPFGTVEDVRSEIRYLKDTYRRPDGRFMLTAGNAINGNCPVPLLDALYDEIFRE